MLKHFSATFGTYAEMHMALVTYNLVPWCPHFVQAIGRIAARGEPAGDVLHLEVNREAFEMVAELRAADQLVMRARSPIAGDPDRPCCVVANCFQSVSDQPHAVPCPALLGSQGRVDPALNEFANAKMGGQLDVFDSLEIVDHFGLL